MPKLARQWSIAYQAKLDRAKEKMAPDEAVKALLRYMGQDPDSDGLKDTPKRVLKAWDEMTAGYEQDPAEILSKDFKANYDEMIVVPFVEFYSTCEHHLLPFFGVAHVGYLPSNTNPRVVGLSKLARLVDCFARRLQIQERMTVEIAEAMKKHLKPAGVAVVIQAKHLCMACRGVQKHKACMVTSSMSGSFMKPTPRQEFFKLIDLAGKGI